MFATNRITDQPVRSLAIVAGTMPLIGIFAANYKWPTTAKEGNNVIGRPAGSVFLVAWLGIVAILLFASVVAALRFDTAPLAIYGSVLVLVAIVAVAWLYQNNSKEDKATASQLMGLLVLLTALFWTVSAVAACDSNEMDVHLVLGSLATVPLVWSVLATLWAYLSANK